MKQEFALTDTNAADMICILGHGNQATIHSFCILFLTLHSFIHCMLINLFLCCAETARALPRNPASDKETLELFQSIIQLIVTSSPPAEEIISACDALLEALVVASEACLSIVRSEKVKKQLSRLRMRRTLSALRA
jgi:hypothetical protein